MYPYGFHHHHFRGPSRIFWAFVGAGIATLWHHSHDNREHRARYFQCTTRDPRRIDGDVPMSEHPTPPVYSRPDSPAPQDNRRNAVFNNNQPDHGQNGTWGWSQREWNADKERLKDIQKRTEDAMLDMSESTLESIASTLESLKTKITEHKTKHEQQRKRYEEELERVQNEPRRYV